MEEAMVVAVLLPLVLLIQVSTRVYATPPFFLNKVLLVSHLC
jgi:hypothetical protein